MKYYGLGFIRKVPHFYTGNGCFYWRRAQLVWFNAKEVQLALSHNLITPDFFVGVVKK